jgi:hypothetical protein
MGDWWSWSSVDGNWTQQGLVMSPPPRQDPSMVYDADRQNVVMFGGGEGNASSRNDTWTWDGSAWTKRTPATRPTWRVQAAMADDPDNHQVVLFGGADAEDSNTLFGDTWAWKDSNWALLSPPDSPSAREGAQAVYDAADHTVVLFGGIGGCNTFCNDTWIWKDGNWVKKDPDHRPPGRSFFSMAYDAERGQVVIFGGECNTPPVGLCDDTWTWAHGDWTQQTPTAIPPRREESQMAYDPINRDVVMFSGLGCGADTGFVCPADTWIWDGFNWEQLSLSVSPPARYGGAMSFDSNGSALLFGGYVEDPGVDSGSFTFGVKPAIVRVLGLAGGTVTAPNTVSSTNPLKTSVVVGSTATGGLVSIAQPSPNETPPAGVRFLRAQASVKAPKGSLVSPLTLGFTLDDSLVADPNRTVRVYRAQGTNRPVQVPACAGPGVLSPNPCVSSETPTGGGGVHITVLTSSASGGWNFGVAGTSLSVAERGSGSGTVTSQPWGMDCQPVCRAGFPSGTNVTLTAIASAGSVFSHWSGTCTGAGSCKATMSAPRSETARFAHKPDAWVKLKGAAKYRGIGVYNTTAVHQTRRVNAKRTKTKTFDISVQNRGSGPVSFKLRGAGSTTNFKVVYLAGLTGTTNITSAVKAGTYKLKNLPSGARKNIRIVITVRSTAKIGASFNRLITARSTETTLARDAVKCRIDVVR